MKSVLGLILVFSSVFLLCSCNQEPAPTTTAPTQTQEVSVPTTIETEPTEPLILVEQVPMLAISLPTTSSESPILIRWFTSIYSRTWISL